MKTSDRKSSPIYRITTRKERLARPVATLLVGLLLMTSSVPSSFATPAPQEDRNLSKLRTKAIEFGGGSNRVRVWMKGNTDMTGWINQVGQDSLGFTEEANLQDRSLDFAQIEKIAVAGQNERLWRWKWDELQKAVVVGTRVAITTRAGVRLEGAVLETTPAEMAVDVKNSSDKRLQSKGDTVLARDSITSVRLKKRHIKGRVAGAVTGAGLGALFATSALYAETSEGASGGQAGGIFAGTVGVFYLIGWLSDRRSHKNETLILLMPD